MASHPAVPDPSSILLQIPHWAKYFTVIDLTTAIFSIPLDEDRQLLFAFTWNGQQLTWTGLRQGFAGSPTFFSRIPRNYLKDVEPPGESALVQYVDDLLITSKDKDACIKDTIHLCIVLAEKGHHASPSKLQLCKKGVKYLGFILREGQRVIDPERMKAIVKLPCPIIKKQL